MNILFIEYPKCSTCRKAKKWLEAQGIRFEDRHIVEDHPTAAELKEWIGRSGLPARKFFNTSGKLYREMGIKERLGEMSEDEMAELLASDGMLIKRPLVIGDSFVLAGFKEDEWKQKMGLDK